MNVQTKPAEDADAGSWPSWAGARRRPPSPCATPRPTPRTAALADGARLIRAETAAILAANARDIDGREGRRHDAALHDRLLLDEARVEGDGQGPRRHRRPARPGRRRDRALDAAQRAGDQPRARADRHHRRHLRGAGPTSRPMPARSASRRATSWCCAAAPTASIPRAPSSSCCAARWRRPACPRIACSSCRPPTARRSARCCARPAWLDLIVPRGGRSPDRPGHEESRVPVLRHYDGICHVYVDRDADVAMARDDRRQRQDAPGRASAAPPRPCWSTAPRSTRT